MKIDPTDPRDWQTWKINHDEWTRLISAAEQAKKGRAPEWYTELLAAIRDDEKVIASAERQ